MEIQQYRGFQKDLAKQVKVDYSYISKILKGIRTPSIETAKKLEHATGVNRLAWLYPEEYSNPYMEITCPKKPKN